MSEDERPGLREWWKSVPVHRKFQASTAVILLVVFVVLFLMVASTVRQSYMEVNPQILIEETKNLARERLKPGDFSAYDEAGAQEDFARLRASLRNYDVIQFMVFDTAGRVLYSDNSSEIGQTYEIDEYFEQAMSGNFPVVVSEYSLTPGTLTQTKLEQVIEVYAPITPTGEEDALGLMKYSQRIDTLKGVLLTTLVKLALFFVGSLVVIYIALNAFFLEAQRGMEAAIKHLQDINAKKNDFISITAHELKTPITVVIGSYEMIMKDAKTLPSRFKEYFKMMKREIERMNSLITEMLDISRIDLKTVDFVYSEVDVPALLRNGVKGLETMLRKKRLSLRLSIGPSVGKATIDKDRVWQVVSNLVMNAAKFSQDGKNIFLSVAPEGEMLVFSVRDEGPGIAPEHRDKIFERLYQVDRAATRQHGGLGLGLAICKGFVEGMGGTITLEIELGHGATFSFTVPVAGKQIPLQPRKVEDLSAIMRRPPLPSQEDLPLRTASRRNR